MECGKLYFPISYESVPLFTVLTYYFQITNHRKSFM